MDWAQRHSIPQKDYATVCGSLSRPCCYSHFCVLSFSLLDSPQENIWRFIGVHPPHFDTTTSNTIPTTAYTSTLASKIQMGIQHQQRLPNSLHTIEAEKTIPCRQAHHQLSWFCFLRSFSKPQPSFYSRCFKPACPRRLDYNHSSKFSMHSTLSFTMHQQTWTLPFTTKIWQGFLHPYQQTASFTHLPSC